jgi:succinate-semialdehyde dehydrogenase/glutarate-semialdehyde dehydrogenase
MVGNTKFIKHLSTIPQCTIAIEKIFLEVEASIMLYTNLLISTTKASELVFHKRIKGILLTGCEDAVASIATKADKYFKKKCSGIRRK